MHIPWGSPRFDIKDMIGKTFVSVANIGDQFLSFTAENGDKYVFYHDQDCCETVEIQDVVGDLEDLVGSPILEADEASNNEEGDWDSRTWTFYKFGTIKGHVNIRWLGSSNGYYSESVDQCIIKAGGVDD
jgi:hypothetical protein